MEQGLKKMFGAWLRAAGGGRAQTFGRFKLFCKKLGINNLHPNRLLSQNFTSQSLTKTSIYTRM